MASLRDRLARNPVSQYFADLPWIDRATALIVLLLLSAFVAVVAALMNHREPTVGAAPALTAPPFELRFAAARADVSVPA